MMKKKVKNTQKKSKRMKRKTLKKIRGGQLPEFKSPLNETVKGLLATTGTIESGKNTMKEIYDSFSTDEKKSITTYQNKSIVINGFLRETFSIYSNKKINTDVSFTQEKEEFIEDLKYEAEERKEDIKNLDHLFLHKSPKFQRKTVLIRGTDDFYSEGLGYTSTTKNFETLFTMIEKGDDFLSVRKKCCINVLIVDENIPYLDLEIEQSKWVYQQEILLPRNLNFSVAGESIYEYKGIDYKVYFYHVTLKDGFRNENEYIIPESDYDRFDFDKESFIEESIIKFLLEKQAKEFGSLFSFIKEDSPFFQDAIGKLQDLDSIFKYYKTRTIVFLCTRKKYLDICEEVLTILKDLLHFIRIHDLIKPEFEDKIVKITQKANELLDILPSGNLVIDDDNFINILHL